jgi:bacillithiol system protein YtxJ
MSFFDGFSELFNGGADLDEQWNIPAIDDDFWNENSGTHLIYKHSYACGICVFTKQQVEALMQQTPQIDGWHFVDVRKNRDVSNYIAEKTGVRHESPQAILIQNGKVVWHASHTAIKAETIKNVLDESSLEI